MAKWEMTRKTFLLSGILTLWSDFPVFAANVPTLKLGKAVNASTLQFLVTSPIAASVYLEYGIKIGTYGSRTPSITLKKGASTTMLVSGLSSGTKYFFRLRYLATGKTYLSTSSVSVTTPAPSLSAIFAVQADPHMDENSSADVYNKSLDLVVASGATFLMDLGDIFMVDKLADKSETNIRARYTLLKGFYDRLKGLPLKIVLGNHDGELGYSSFNTKKYRAEYFPEQTHEVSYFSYVESNVLHIGLDPFTYTTSNPKTDGWHWTLGKVQYDWLVKTLQTSKERHKFVYIHHLLVGDTQSRGGTKIASYNEWGGKNMDGTNGFDQMRPSWGKPIHQLLKENNVSIVFKGHDHLYVKEEMDGIIYQTVPQPSHPGDGTNSAVEYGYGAGKVVGGSGFLKVTASDTQVQVDFVKYDGTIGDTYTLQG